MKRICAAAIVTLMTFLAYAGLADASQRKLTILVYMRGSNLESGYGSATADLDEMLAAEYDTRQVTVLVMTGGTSGSEG